MAAALVGTTALPIIPAVQHVGRNTACLWSPIEFTEWRHMQNAAALVCYATCVCETHGSHETGALSQQADPRNFCYYFVPLMITFADLAANDDDPNIFKHMVESQQWIAAAIIEDFCKEGCHMSRAIKQVYA